MNYKKKLEHSNIQMEEVERKHIFKPKWKTTLGIPCSVLYYGFLAPRTKLFCFLSNIVYGLVL